jgi:hypothetical protein
MLVEVLVVARPLAAVVQALFLRVAEQWRLQMV